MKGLVPLLLKDKLTQKCDYTLCPCLSFQRHSNLSALLAHWPLPDVPRAPLVTGQHPALRVWWGLAPATPGEGGAQELFLHICLRSLLDPVVSSSRCRPPPALREGAVQGLWATLRETPRDSANAGLAAAFPPGPRHSLPQPRPTRGRPCCPTTPPEEGSSGHPPAGRSPPRTVWTSR